MHLHEGPQAAPLLGPQGVKNAIFCMQIHAPYTCMCSLAKASQEKSLFS
ncbi:acetyl xylan esterase [Serratia marcescens]|nr:acetyl xylan esterase [Serratia marcescens]PNU28950.1 acetyl xylan esterase [Serratia marcescens]PNU48357.1 acetyl xylan esterase [Serratia marcescens]